MVKINNYKYQKKKMEYQQLFCEKLLQLKLNRIRNIKQIVDDELTLDYLNETEDTLKSLFKNEENEIEFIVQDRGDKIFEDLNKEFCKRKWSQLGEKFRFEKTLEYIDDLSEDINKSELKEKLLNKIEKIPKKYINYNEEEGKIDCINCIEIDKEKNKYIVKFD